MLYDGPEGKAYVHFIEGMPIIHSEIISRDLHTMKKVLEISNGIDEAFRQRGFPVIETWAETTEQDKFNKFLGYEYEDVVEFMPEDYPHEVRRYRKTL